MAELIPDRLPSRASKGEERLFSILKNLPDDYIIYYEPIVENRYALRVIIHPEIRIAPPSSPVDTGTGPADVHRLKVLDPKQENNARKIGDGHRILYGVAGSGKMVGQK